MNQIDIEDLKRVKLGYGDVLWLRVKVGNINRQQQQMYFESLKAGLQGIFPRNKIVVTTDEVEMSVITNS